MWFKTTKTTMIFLPEGRTARFSGDQTVLTVALANKIPISHSCGGMGSCGTCLIRVEAGGGGLPERNEIEAEMAQDRGLSSHERLACQIPAQEGLQVCVVNPDFDESSEAG